MVLILASRYFLAAHDDFRGARTSACHVGTPLKAPLRLRSSCRLQGDSMAQSLQLANAVASEVFGVDSIEVVGSEILIATVVSQHGNDGDEQRMAHRHNGPFLAALGTQPMKQRGKVSLPGAGGGPSHLAQDALEPAVPRTSLAGELLAGAL